MSISAENTTHESVAAGHTAPEPTPEEAAQLKELYRDFDRENLIPLWTEIADLMPMVPTPQGGARTSGGGATCTRWPPAPATWSRWAAAGNAAPSPWPTPAWPARPYATPTLWAAIQYLGARETAPEHRHSQNAFRFVVEGEGVWTVVNGDPVRMPAATSCSPRAGTSTATTTTPISRWPGSTAWTSRSCTTPTPGSSSSAPSASPTRPPRTSPAPSGSGPTRACARSPGLDDTTSSPIAAYRWEHTDRALAEQLLLEDEGHPATVSQGHAAVRYTNPTTGGDVMPTIRAEFHRLRAGASTEPLREVGSSVWQVFEGSGSVVLNGETRTLEKGDLFVVPSWAAWSLQADRPSFDLFRFSDAPIFERLNFNRTYIEGRNNK